MVNNNQHDLPLRVKTLLSALRRRIRRYVWIEGIAAAVAWLGAAFWGSLVIDWFFEPSGIARGLLLSATGIGFIWIVYRFILRRAFVQLSDRNMAMLLERYFPQFNESLLTAVELSEKSVEERVDESSPEMLARTCRLTAQPATDIRLGRVFNPIPIRLMLGAALFLTLAVITLGFFCPQVMGIWTRRTLLFSNELWPRRTRLLVEGFEDGLAKVARGADLSVVAKADLRKPVVPNVVKVCYRTGGGALSEAPMSRDGTADPKTERFQVYSHTFGGVLTPFVFDVVGGDDKVRNLRVEVVDNPTIVEMSLECRSPAYIDRPARKLPVTGPMQIPLGTDLTLRAKSNKRLVRVEVESTLNESHDGPIALSVERSDPQKFVHNVSDFQADMTLLFTLYDADGIRSREPTRLVLATIEDTTPIVAVQLRGIGSAITPKARLPVKGRISDDYGLARVWFQHSIDQQAPAEVPIETLSKHHLSEYPLDQAIDLRTLDLKPGQKIQICVKASDRYDRVGGPNVGTSDRWLLDIVTAEQLRVMLEARELVLRQRFEAILAEVVEGRDSLERIRFVTPSSAETPARSAGAEPGDAPDSALDISPQRRLGLHKMRVDRVLQNSQKNAHEILGVAESFDNVREQLINNRIDTEELKERLGNGISQPLRQIVEQMYPEFDRRLDQLTASLSDSQSAPENRRLAVAQVDTILRAMRQVLARMIELEDFNEAIELLRDIIDAQQKLHEKTDQRHKQKLRELLEDT